MSAREPFLVDGPFPRGRTVLEASAGTGKTYSLTALITRYIAELGVPVDEILVVTFTCAAANELRERTRHTLSEAAECWRQAAGAPAMRGVALQVHAVPGDAASRSDLIDQAGQLIVAVATGSTARDNVRRNRRGW